MMITFEVKLTGAEELQRFCAAMMGANLGGFTQERAPAQVLQPLYSNQPQTTPAPAAPSFGQHTLSPPAPSAPVHVHQPQPQSPALMPTAPVQAAHAFSAGSQGVTHADVSNAMSGVLRAQQKTPDQIKALLTAYGVNRVPELTPDKLPSFLMELTA